MKPLVIERIDVGSRHIDALVRVTEQAFARTSCVPDVAERALALLPGLRRHSCENGSAHGIAAELSDTETPHLLEHIAFELMALAGSPRTLRGETSWDFSADGVGVYHVWLAYDDDLVALGSLKAAVHVVEWLMSPAEMTGESAEQRPDVERIVARLRALRTEAG